MKTSNKLSKPLKLELLNLLSSFPPQEMRTHLRTIYTSFLDKDEAGQAKCTNEQRQHIQALFNFLALASNETMKWKKEV